MHCLFMYSVHVNFTLWIIQAVFFENLLCASRKKGSLIDLMSGDIKIWSKIFRGSHLPFAIINHPVQGKSETTNSVASTRDWADGTPPAVSEPSLWQATSGLQGPADLGAQHHFVSNAFWLPSVLREGYVDGNCLCRPNYAGSETGL